MATHAITFRLEHDSGYSDRYKSVVAAIRGVTETTYLDEPTSFALIESKRSSKQVIEQIDKSSTFDVRKDLLLVINLSEKGYTALGDLKDVDLHSLMQRR